jgi:hypothetical protein
MQVLEDGDVGSLYALKDMTDSKERAKERRLQQLQSRKEERKEDVHTMAMFSSHADAQSLLKEQEKDRERKRNAPPSDSEYCTSMKGALPPNHLSPSALLIIRNAGGRRRRGEMRVGLKKHRLSDHGTFFMRQ